MWAQCAVRKNPCRRAWKIHVHDNTHIHPEVRCFWEHRLSTTLSNKKMWMYEWHFLAYFKVIIFIVAFHFYFISDWHITNINSTFFIKTLRIFSSFASFFLQQHAVFDSVRLQQKESVMEALQWYVFDSSYYIKYNVWTT